MLSFLMVWKCLYYTKLTNETIYSVYAIWPDMCKTGVVQISAYEIYETVLSCFIQMIVGRLLTKHKQYICMGCCVGE